MNSLSTGHSMDTSPSSENTTDFIKLLTAHQSALRGLIAAMLPGSGDIDDILQDTNVVLWEKRDIYDRKTEFKPWAYGIARNKVRQHWSKKKQHAGVSLPEEFLDAVADARQAQHADDFDKRRSALMHCLTQLRPRDRDLIYACYEAREGLDSRVRRFGLTAASIRVTTHRIRKKLRECVEKRLSWQGDGA